VRAHVGVQWGRGAPEHWEHWADGAPENFKHSADGTPEHWADSVYWDATSIRDTQHIALVEG
jgi:hypothetical protein